MEPFIPKDDPEMPDSYGLDVNFNDGKSQHFDLVSHALIAESTILEIFCTDDCFRWLPVATIRNVIFDKNFMKVLELKNKTKS